MTEFERRLFLRSRAAGAAGGLTAWVQQALAADPKSLKQGLSSVSGDVSVNGKAASEGMAVAPGDVVETGPVGRAVYVIGDSAFMQRPNSRVDFGDTAAASFLRVLTGGLLSVFGKSRRQRQLAVTVATIGIRGTGCYIEAEERKAYFCLCFGAAEVQPMKGRPISYTTTHHEKPLWIADGVMQAAGVINHTDAEVIMLEALAGRRSPFPSGKSGRY